MQKRGAIEIQFNWIFVLIIGAVILTIFAGIILKQKSASETSQNALLLRNLDAILSGSEVSQGTINTIKIPDATIEFRCNRYSVGKLSKQLDVMSVFTPSSITGDRLLSMTKDWSIPFRITNIVYLTSPEYRYVLIGDTALAREALRLMPNETFVELIPSLAELQHKGEDKIRFIFFNDPILDRTPIPPDYSSFSDSDVSALKVTGNAQVGTVEFFEKIGPSFQTMGTHPYIESEIMLGAIFADAPNVYNCVMENLFEKLHVVSEVYFEKTTQIRDEYTALDDRCAELKSTAYNLNALSQIKAGSFTEPSVRTIADAAEQLKIQNKRAQLQSCATIY